jgi:hypothetical protein
MEGTEHTENNQWQDSRVVTSKSRNQRDRRLNSERPENRRAIRESVSLMSLMSLMSFMSFVTFMSPDHHCPPSKCA